MENLQMFANRLKELRKSMNITQVAMSDILDCTESHYQKIEYGKVNISTLTLIIITEYFNVSIDYLVGRTDIPEINKR